MAASNAAQIIAARFSAAMKGEALHTASPAVRSELMAAIRQAMQSNALKRDIGMWCMSEFLKHHVEILDAAEAKEAAK